MRHQFPTLRERHIEEHLWSRKLSQADSRKLHPHYSRIVLYSRSDAQVRALCLSICRRLHCLAPTFELQALVERLKASAEAESSEAEDEAGSDEYALPAPGSCRSAAQLTMPHMAERLQTARTVMKHQQRTRLWITVQQAGH